MLLACLIFKGLSNFFNNFAFRKYKELTKNIVNINIFKFIFKLILEEVKIIFNIGGKVNKVFKFRLICRHCNKIKYLKFNCFIKYFKLINDFNFNKNKKGKFNKNNKKENKKIKTKLFKVIIMAINSFNINNNKKFILNSGITKYYIPYKN